MAASAAVQDLGDVHDHPFKKSFADIEQQHPRTTQLEANLSRILVPQNSSIVREPSTYRGQPAIFFTEEDVQQLSQPFCYSLIGKFSKGRPNMENLRKAFHSIGFQGIFSLGLLISEPLKVDASTVTLNRPSVARFCIEVDLWQSLPKKLWVGNGTSGFWRPVEYDNLPDCSCCQKVGHSSDLCRNSGKPMHGVAEQKQQDDRSQQQRTVTVQPTQVPLNVQQHPPAEQSLDKVFRPQGTSYSHAAASAPPGDGLAMQPLKFPFCDDSKLDCHMRRSWKNIQTIHNLPAFDCVSHMDEPHSPMTQLADLRNLKTQMDDRIWVCWSKLFAGNVLRNGDQFLQLVITHESIPTVFYSTFVYAKCTRQERHELWSTIQGISSTISRRPWLLGGDFNVISFLEEYLGSSPQDMGTIADFNSCLHSCLLKQARVVGSKYTWTGIRNGRRIWKKLDHVLYNNEWEQHFPRLCVHHLNRTSSDHSPLLCLFDYPSWPSQASFKFQHMWVRHSAFMNIVQQNWNLPFEGYGMHGLAGKLKHLKRCLQAWNRTAFGNAFDNVAQAEELVCQKVICLEQENTTTACLEWSQAQANLLQALANEEIFWKQKVRVKWLKEVDSNKKFFHAYVQDKRERLHINRIKTSGGEWIEDFEAIAVEGAAFFQTLPSQEHADPTEGLAKEQVAQRLLQSIPLLVSPHQNASLIQMVTPEKVRDAVFGLDSDSAAGPDGFSGLFFKHCWDIVATDIFKAVQEFFIGVPIPKSISNMVIVLVPKKDACSSFEDYRPISLNSFINKIFSKVLCNRLKPLLPALISKEQSGFVQGRDITDNLLLGQELVGSLDKKCCKRLVFTHFVALILSNLTVSRFSLLINGKPCGFFNALWGLKEGDPLSPYLFILGVEALSRGLNKLFETGAIASYALPHGCPSISYLSFADDIMVFGRADRKSLRGLMDFLTLYEYGSGQKVNTMKSFFVLPHRSSTVHSRLPLVDKLQRRLASWKGKLLNAGGRMILIKHVLAAIPLYTLSVLDSPQQVLKRLE
nr:uncharacterized protein LOC113724473 [Coffea arabica]